MQRPRVLVIAGSDPSGGAGLEADQKVLAAHGIYACTATTALTVQNTLGVEDVLVTDTNFVGRQIRAVAADLGFAGVKLGMLASKGTIEVVAKELELLRSQGMKNVVLDPVLISSSGHQLLPIEAVRDLRAKLLPMTTILTPNMPEAQLLVRDAGHDIADATSLDDMKHLAKLIQELGPKAVLLKGGHLPLSADYRRSNNVEDHTIIVDLLYDGNEFTTISTGYLRSKNTHGTGCSLASAIAANLVSGKKLVASVKEACQYVEVGIRTSDRIGKGTGPINHFHSLQILPFAPDHFLEYVLERDDVAAVWNEFLNHGFVKKLSDGSLEKQIFQDYLVQDYLYLVQFARSHALAAYKSKNIDDISRSASIVLHIEKEMSLHLDYCAIFGLTKGQIEARKESLACTAYSRYMLDVGQSEDWLALQIALAPCLIGYGQVAKRIHTDASSKQEGNPYWKWVENYVAKDFVEAVKTGSELIEKHVRDQSPARIEELVGIFIRSTEMEVQFWNLGSHTTLA